MSFLKRNKDKSLIPPVASEVPLPRGPSPAAGRPAQGTPLPSYRSTASTYNASRDGDPYNPPAPSPAAASYSRRDAVGDQYSRGQGDVSQDRSELFAGYKPEKGGSGRFFDGPPEPVAGEENDEDVEGIKQQTRTLKQDSVNSTRNALRLAREAEETARNTMLKLGDQSEKLANTERHLDVAKGHSQRADDRTDELKQLNRSIFRPVITFNKEGKRRAQEQKTQDRFEEDRQERERTMMDIRDSQNRVGRAATYGQGGDDDDAPTDARSRFRAAENQDARKAARARYQHEATASDDEMEDELDENLNEISDATKRLKALGLAMNQELDNQIGRIGRIEDKTVKLDNRVFRNTERLKKV